jgi:phosphoglycerate dehydrogenase-like enzyme
MSGNLVSKDSDGAGFGPKRSAPGAGADGTEETSPNAQILIPAAFFGDVTQEGQCIERVFASAHRERIARITDLYPRHVTTANIEECLPELRNLQVIFSTWGMLNLTDAVLDRLPSLQAVFYAGGTVKSFCMPLLRRGITITSSAAANALPVAEFALAQFLLANKGYFRNVREYHGTRAKSHCLFQGQGNLGATVALLGLGRIGRQVLNLLAPFDLRTVVYDPFLSAEEIGSKGAEKVDLAEAFIQGNVVSNHLADVPETEGLIDGRLIASMRRDATFINTGRGRTVREEEMIEVLRARPDLTALLDVTHPEPPVADSMLWTLPNVSLSAHIAGSIGKETGRMAEHAIEEFERWRRGEPLLHAVKLEAVMQMA